MSKKHEYWHPVVDKKRLVAFLNDSLLKKSWTINQLEQKPAMQTLGLLTSHRHFKGQPLTLGLVNSPEHKTQTSTVPPTVSHVPFEALAILRFRHLGLFFKKLRDFVPRILHFSSKCRAEKYMNIRAA